VEEGHRVAFLLPVGRVGGIERAEGPVPRADVALEGEAARRGGERGEAVIPPPAILLGSERVDPQREGRVEADVISEGVLGAEAEALLEPRVALLPPLPAHAVE